MCSNLKAIPPVSLFFNHHALNAEKCANKFNLNRSLFYKSIDHYLK